MIRATRDAAFERVRTRAVLSHLAEAGLSCRHIALAAARLRRANTALDEAVREAERNLLAVTPEGAAILERTGFAALPEEIRVRLIGRTVAPLWRPPRRLAPRRGRGPGALDRRWPGCRPHACRLPPCQAKGGAVVRPRAGAAEPAAGCPRAGNDHGLGPPFRNRGRRDPGRPGLSVMPVGSLPDRPDRPPDIPDFIWRPSPAILADSRAVWLFGSEPGKAGQGVTVNFLAS